MTPPIWEQPPEEDGPREEGRLLYGIGAAGAVIALTGSALWIGGGLLNHGDIPDWSWWTGWSLFGAGTAIGIPAVTAYHLQAWNWRRKHGG